MSKLKINAGERRIGLSITDPKALTDAQLADHIAALDAKRPMNWTPTAANLRASRFEQQRRIGRAVGYEFAGVRVREGDQVMILLSNGSVYEGRLEVVTEDGLTIFGESSHFMVGRPAGRTGLRRSEVAEVAR